MRLLALLSVLLYLSLATATGQSCLKVITALVSRPGDIFNHFQREICDRGCQPTVPHWDLWTRNHSFVPAVHSLVKRLNIPGHEEALIKLGDEAADRVKSQCGPMLEGTHICADPETVSAFGNCFKKSFLKSAIMNLPVLLPLATEEACRTQYEYLKGDELWDVVIPNNMREYGEACGSLPRMGNIGVQMFEDYTF